MVTEKKEAGNQPGSVSEQAMSTGRLKSGRFWPEIKGADDEIRSCCYERAHLLYGEDLPEAVRSRLDMELDAITDNGFTIIYHTARELARMAREDGTPVSFRGNGGSSLAAFLAGITDINPLPPHYVCPECRHYEEPDHQEKYETGWELPEKSCPVCGNKMRRDGYSIPPENFFGLKKDRIPLLDLTVAEGFGHSTARHLKEIFPDCNIYQAHPDLMDVNGANATASFFIVPEQYSIQDFTPLKEDSISPDFKETQLTSYELDLSLFRFDITESSSLFLLERFSSKTGTALERIPLDSFLVNELYVSDSPFTNSIMRRLSDITGMSWKRETAEVRNMLKTVDAGNMSDYIRVAALVEGTGTWNEYVKDLIESKVCTIRDIITTREDILNYLRAKGMETEAAYGIMRKVSLGIPLKPDQSKLMKEHGVPDWYIESCSYIDYLMPRAWACSRAVNSTKIAWFLVLCLDHFCEVWEEYQWEQFI